MQQEPDRVARRPFGVMLITLLWLVYALLAALFLFDRGLVEVSGIARLLGAVGLLASAHVALALLALTSAVGLWFLRPWGWIASMLLAGVNLGVEVVSYFMGLPAFSYLAVAVVIAFYLNLGTVRGRFFDEPEAAGLRPHPPAE